jgi:hypothetical protein
MQLVLSFYQPMAEIERHEHPAESAAALQPWKAYMAELAAAGVMRAGNRLAPPWTATTVRMRSGERLIQDGPFAETREMAAGYVVSSTCRRSTMRCTGRLAARAAIPAAPRYAPWWRRRSE